MLELMILGAVAVGGAYLAHKLYKRAKDSVAKWVRSNSGLFSRIKVDHIYVVFEALRSGLVGYHVIAQLTNGKLEHVERTELKSVKDVPDDARSKVEERLEAVKKRKGFLGLGPKEQTEDVYVAKVVE